MGKWTQHIAYAFSTFVLRRQSPYLFGMVITDLCNLDCFYCESKNSGDYHFSLDHALGTLREAYARGHRSLYFTGGEPMLWEDGGRDLSFLVAEAHLLGFSDIFIFTNGTVPLTIPGCSYIVTIDGPREVHNRIRGGSYDHVIENVRGAATQAVFASITFSRENVEYCEDFVEEICALELFRGISFNLLTHWPEIVESHGIHGEERIKLLDQLWRLKRQGYPIALSGAAYRALRANNFKRPIPQIELGTRDRIFTCCRDVDNPSICANCGYANCVEVSQILALKPSAIWQVLKLTARV